jgi:WD40 repeat protein
MFKDETDLKALPTDAVNVAWTLDPNSPFEPLLIFSHLNLLYIYNVNRKGICSYLRGHGGVWSTVLRISFCWNHTQAITAIAVHPLTVNLFCTTSRDYSTRIYDLKLPPQDGPSNPHWPPGREGSRAGAAHGLHMTEAEGSGSGRCIIVLMGGRSGGHQAAVLGAVSVASRCCDISDAAYFEGFSSSASSDRHLWCQFFPKNPLWSLLRLQ